MTSITEQQFDESIKEGLVAVKLYGDWCGFCTKLAPILDEVETELADVKFYALHIARADMKTSPTCLKYNVTGLPRLLMFKDGALAGEMKGYKVKDQVINILKTTLLGYNIPMQNQIDITKLSVVELKALVYDRIAIVELNQTEIKAINQEIAKRPTDAKPEPAK